MRKVTLLVQAGQQFDRLTVIDPETRKGSVRAAACICACGATGVLVPIRHLVHERIRSCGCIKREQTAERNRATASRGGITRHPLFSTWAGMVNRCYSPAASNYRWYGARGVQVADVWLNDPAAFIAYVEQTLGPKPGPGYSIDRMDNARDYAPGNLRWATAQEQAHNRRTRAR